jgi:predicted DCC family thiol-disulfide oxidoreductase YuxK
MKVTDKTLIYDDDCPLCAAYTSAFVKTGILHQRKPFSDASPELLHTINWQRSKNEIPLLDPATKQVWYGIDALLEILGGRFPWIKTVGRAQPVNYLLKKLYNFISYNRKVIVAIKATPGKIDCTPAFNVFYRVLFMLVFMVVSTSMLLPVHHLLQHIPFYTLSPIQLLSLHLAMIVINTTIACCLPKQAAFEYLGQINMLSILTLLLTIPLIITNKYVQVGAVFNYSYLALVLLVIFGEYFRRMDFAHLLQNRLIVFINLCCIVALCTCLLLPIQ